MRRLRIKELLKEKGVSQGKLSRGADIPPNTIRRMINDPNYNPTIATLMRVADYLSVKLDDLYTEDDKEKPEQ